MVTFAIFFDAAMIRRKDAVWHKRMILFASLALMTPAIARLFQPLGAESLTMPAWLAALAAIAIFDIKQFGKVTRATWFGLAVSIAFAAALLVIMILLGPELNSLKLAELIDACLERSHSHSMALVATAYTMVLCTPDMAITALTDPR
ncbi:MAG: hypothetical protein AAF270_14780 [Pseudomonadota bacterium]